MTNEKFFGYKHWTLEETPRCFNVGKGVANRAKSKRSRNHKWHAIVKQYGIRIEICIGPVLNKEACTWETENIEQMKTFSSNHSHDDINDIGCNFTKGGEGSNGCFPSNETRDKMSKSHLGNDGGAATMRGRPLSETHKQAIQKALKGNPNVSNTLLGNSHTLGFKFSEKSLKKRSETVRLKNQQRKFLLLLQKRVQNG